MELNHTPEKHIRLNQKDLQSANEKISYRNILNIDEVIKKYKDAIADTIVLRDLSLYVRKRIITKKEMKKLALRINPYLYMIISNTRIEKLYDTLDATARRLSVAKRFIQKIRSRIDKDYVLVVHMRVPMGFGVKYIVSYVTRPFAAMYTRPYPLLKNVDTRRTRLNYTEPRLLKYAKDLKIYDTMEYLYDYLGTAWYEKEVLPLLRIIGKLDGKIASRILWHLACGISRNANDRKDLFVAKLLASLSRLDMNKYRTIIEGINNLLERISSYPTSLALSRIVKEKKMKGELFYVEGTKYDKVEINDNEVLLAKTMVNGVVFRKDNMLRDASKNMVIICRIYSKNDYKSVFVVRKIK